MRFKLSTAALAAGVATALTAGAASAGVTFYPYGVGAPTLPLITNFGSDTVGSAPTHAPGGWSWSGNGLVVNTTGPNPKAPLYAKPAVYPGTTPFKNYLAIEQGHSETLTIPASARVEDLNIYVGSLDSFNKVTFDLAGGAVDAYTGVWLAKNTTVEDGGSQNSGHSNGVLNFTFDAPVEKIIFQSPGGNSLEIASIAGAFATGVPEPSEWLMLTLGVAMVGAFARRRRSFAGAAAVA